jgi:hypothetical protein
MWLLADFAVGWSPAVVDGVGREGFSMLLGHLGCSSLQTVGLDSTSSGCKSPGEIIQKQ